MAGTQQVRGIASRFDGTCPLCTGSYGIGDIVEKISDQDTRRAHLQCVVNARNARPPQSQQHPAGAQYDQRPTTYQQPTQTPAPAAARPAQSVLGQIDPFNSAIPAALWQLFEGLTMVSQGAMKASIAVEQIARIIDPHGAKRPGGSQ